MKRSLRKLALLVFFVSSVMLVSAGAWLVATNAGATWLVNFVRSVLPGQLTFAQLDGVLIGPLTLRDVEYRDETFGVAVQRLRFDWRALQLLWGEAHIDSLEIDTLTITVSGTAPSGDEAPFSLPDIHLPLLLQIRHLKVADLKIVTDGVETLRLNSIETSLDTVNNMVVIRKLDVEHDSGSVSLSGNVQPVGLYPARVELAWHFAQPPYAPLAGAATISGDLNSYKLSHRLTAPVTATLNAEIRNILKDVNWQATLSAPRFQLDAIRGDLPPLAVAGDWQVVGDVSGSALKGNTRLTYGDEQVTTTSTIRVRGTKVSIGEFVATTAKSPAKLSAKGNIDLGAAQPSIDIQGKWQQMQWPLRTSEPLVASQEGAFHAEGSLNDYQMRIDGQVEVSQLLPSTQLLATAVGNSVGLFVNYLSAETQRGDEIYGAGEVTWDETMRLNAALSWPTLGWPLTAPAVAQSQNGSLVFQGAPDDFLFSLNGDFHHEATPAVSLLTRGQGTTTGIRLMELRADTLEGIVTGQADATWSPAFEWNARLSGKDLNPGAYWQAWPGKLSMAVRHHGEVGENTFRYDVQLDKLSGTLLEQPVKGFVNARLTDEVLTIDPAFLRWGASNVIVSGQRDDSWAISWQAQLQDLPPSALPFDVVGISSGSIVGARSRPRLVTDTGVDSFSVGNLTANGIVVAADVDLTDKHGSQVRAHVDHIASGAATITNAVLNGDGTSAAHDLSLKASVDGTTAQINAAGTYKDAVWQGTIRESTLRSEALGDWQQAPGDVILGASAQHIDLAPWCWQSAASSVCMTANWAHDAGWEADVTGQAIPLRRFQPLLPPDLDVSGEVGVTAHASQAANQDMRAELSVSSARGELAVQVAVDETASVEYRNAKLHALVDRETIGLALHADLRDDGAFNINLAVASDDLLSTPLPEARLAGSVQLTFNEMSVLEILIEQINDARGTLDALLDVGGTIGQPAIRGAVTVRDGEFGIPLQGIRVSNLSAQVEGLGKQGLSYRIAAQSGGGTMTAQGRIEHPAIDQWHATLELQGERFLIIDIPEYRLFISPDAAVDLTPQHIDVSGLIYIPEGYLRPRDLSTATSVSPDVIVLDEQAEDKTPGPTISTVLRFQLGERIRVDGFGLTGNLTGNVVVIDTPRQLTSAIGEVRIEEGRYRAYGQRLDIERGRLVFVGGPIDDPGLDIRAARQTGDVTAGVHVRGTLRAPELTTYSVPSMGEAEVLSYLLFGRPLDQTSSNEGSQLYQAAVSSGALLAAKRIGNRFGLEEVSVETVGEEEAPVLTVGKYLSPRLYVSYGRGILDEISTFRMRYRLSARWVLEAESGTGSGADIIYTLEKD